ncbi:MAG: T9SS type A sorting domain-containing protein [candidate division Zixibacteria bacterium]|nr:T9SS type A sorting domain-containing protein [candidate division Zixibacteria bacterium]
MKAGADTSRGLFPAVYKTGGYPLPNLQQCTHKVGRLWFTVSNYGIFGNQGNYFLRDCLTGQPTSSAEFPGGSSIEYLLQGALWIGAVVGPDKDTLVHLGTDGWLGVRHFFPGEGASGEFLRRSINRQSPYYDPLAKSDMDLIATFYDTVTHPFFNTGNPDPEDGKTYKPMGLKIVQSSYSWASGWGQDWVMLDYQIHNQGLEPLRKAYVGIYLDADIGYLNTENRSVDDLSGFIFRVPSSSNIFPCADTLGLAYAYDNDGDPEGGSFGATSPKAAIGVRVVRIPVNLSKTRPVFNWWTIDNDGALDWGAQKTPGRINQASGRGQPMGGGMKYYYLSNQEADYDQVYSAIDQSSRDLGFGTGWFPPPGPLSTAVDLANGSDTRFLLSFGPFDVEIGDSLPITFGLILADGFHQEPDNLERNLGTELANYTDPARVNNYKAALNNALLIQNSRLIGQVFDTPFEYAGRLCTVIVNGASGDAEPIRDSIRVGDGVPDFRGPSAPPLPQLYYTIREGEVTVRWFGKETEASRDPFTGVSDFEGYKVHLSSDGYNYTTIGYYDKINWKPHVLLRNSFGIFEWFPSPTPPLTYDQIQELYAVRWDTCLNKPGNITHPIDPKKFSAPFEVLTFQSFPEVDPFRCFPDTTKTGIRVSFGPSFRNRRDTIMYFVPVDFNLGLDQAKLYPSVTDPSNDSAYWYEYKLSGLFPSEPVYLAITSFDNGYASPTLRIDPQEYIPSLNARAVYPFPSDSERVANKLKISVYPNPYRIDHNYSHFEKPKINEGALVSTQKLNFINLPPKCAIRIYTLDGDLVQQINHDKAPNATDAGFETWDMLTRNAQKVAAGMYLFSVESTEGRYIGKILIIQ